MIRIFMSYGMNGRTEKEQQAERRKIRKRAEEIFNDKDNAFYVYEKIWKRKHTMPIREDCKQDLLFHSMNPMKHIRLVDNRNAVGDKKDGRLYYLGQAIMKLDKCDAVIFASDWKNHKGCCIEHDAAQIYDLPIFYCD